MVQLTTPAPSHPTSGLASVEQAMSFLHVSRVALYKLIGSGQLPSLKLGRSRRVPWQELHRLASPVAADLAPSVA